MSIERSTVAVGRVLYGGGDALEMIFAAPAAELSDGTMAGKML